MKKPDRTNRNTDTEATERRIYAFIGFLKSIPGDRAVWAQTVVLAITLIYIRAQLSQLIEQNEAPRRAKVYEMTKEYEKSVWPGIEKVRRLGWRSRLPEVTTEDFNRELQTVDVKESLKSYFSYIVDLDECVQSEVCDKKRASWFLCSDMKSTYQALYHDIKDTKQEEWKKIDYSHYEPTMISIIHDYCGPVDRTIYYLTF